jgi:hypothetical protein
MYNVNKSIVNPIMGISITGTFMGYRSEINGQYSNNFIGIQTAELSGDYGEIKQVIHDIEIFGDHIPYITQAAQEFQGKLVKVWFYPKVIYGISGKNKPYGFIKKVMLKDTLVEVLNVPADLKKTA